MHKEINNFVIIPNDKKLNEYKSNSFILPLKDFSVGFEEYFSIEEINKYSSIYEVSILINKFLHKEDLDNIKNIINKFNNIKYFFIEDFALTSYISKDKLVLFPNHIISNYHAVNYLGNLGYKNVLVSNELTIDELGEIKENTKSNLFYLYVNKNNIMYSKRELLTNYYDNYDIKDRKDRVVLNEEVSNHELLILEENKSSVIFNNKIFCASKYIDKLQGYNLIINFNNINESDKKVILENIISNKLCELIDSDYKFLEDKIMYKVGDLK